MDVTAAVSDSCQQLCLHFSLQAQPQPASPGEGEEKDMSDPQILDLLLSHLKLAMTCLQGHAYVFDANVMDPS